MRKMYLAAALAAIGFLFLFFQFSCTGTGENKQLSQAELISLGDYIVSTSGCDDCHTPKIMTEHGPEMDTTRRLAGYTQDEILPTLDVNALGQGKWAATTMSLTAWVGPWGVSFASNLTPDNATGIGTLSEEMFIKTLREGKYMGVGRPLLPPMPWQVYGMKNDQDLKAIYAYLKSLKPISNKVPDPITPDKAGEMLAGK